MNAIPRLADLQELSSGESCFLILMGIVGCVTTGFVVDAVMQDLALGPGPNGALAFIGVCTGIYLQYRLLAPFRADDATMTIGFAFLLFIELGAAKSRSSRPGR